MNNTLTHYGVKGMKWGIRKEYEGTGGGGGGSWGPNGVASGGGPSPLAASMAGNPRKKKEVGKAETQKMGIKEKPSYDKMRRAETEKDATKAAESLARLEGLNFAVHEYYMNGIDPPKKILDQYYKAQDDFLANCIDMESKYGEAGYDFEFYTDKGADYVLANVYDYKLDDFIYTSYKIPQIDSKSK